MRLRRADEEIVVSDNIPALEKIATQVVQNVCELPDYNSPDDQPNLVMCTVEELHRCVMRALEEESGVDSQPTAKSSKNRSMEREWERWLEARGPDDCNTRAAFVAGWHAHSMAPEGGWPEERGVHETTDELHGLWGTGLWPNLPKCDLVLHFDSVEDAQAAREKIYRHFGLPASPVKSNGEPA